MPELIAWMKQLTKILESGRPLSRQQLDMFLELLEINNCLDEARGYK